MSSILILSGSLFPLIQRKLLKYPNQSAPQNENTQNIQHKKNITLILLFENDLPERALFVYKTNIIIRQILYKVNNESRTKFSIVDSE